MRNTHGTLTIHLQGKEANLFQPAREFLPMIDEVHFLFHSEANEMYFLVIRKAETSDDESDSILFLWFV
jgi:hypothetical protein